VPDDHTATITVTGRSGLAAAAAVLHPAATIGGAVPDWLTELPRWLLWRETTRIDRKTGEVRRTKVPISFHTSKACDVQDPHSWTEYARVAAALAKSKAWDGPGIALGLIEALGELLIGLDLDTCLDPDGDLADWALPFLLCMASYAEVSPSGTGIKIFARLRLADLPEARRLLGLPEGDKDQARTITYGERINGQHVPGAQVFLMSRYFTVTGRHWATTPEDVCLLSLEQLAQLAALFGPNLAARRANGAHQGARDGEEEDDTAPDETAIGTKLRAELAHNDRLRARWAGDTEGLGDTSRSGLDMSVVGLLKRAGFTKGETLAALLKFPHGRGADLSDRHFDLMWRKTKATPPPTPPKAWEEAHPGPEDAPRPPPAVTIRQDGDNGAEKPGEGNSMTLELRPGTGRGGGGGGPLPGPDPDDDEDDEEEIPQPRLDEPAELPMIVCKAGQIDRMYREAEDALLKAGLPLYQRTVLVRPAILEYDAAPPSGSTEPRRTHSSALIAVTAPALTRMLSRAAIFVKYNERKKKHVECDPPPRLVDIILASRGDWRFQVVRGVLTTPTLRMDGSLLTVPGYDPVSRYYLAFPSNLRMPEIPEAPTIEQAREALLRLDRLLDGYDFVDDGGVSRAVALSMLMTQVLRCAMPVSPLLAVSATAPGTGKSHLVDLCSHIATGRWCPIMNAGKDDNETEKGINTKLMSGVPGFSIDNVYKRLNLEALNTATERPLLSPRNFGTLTDIEIENGTVIYQTGNNLDVLDEQVRRTMLCRMDAGEEQPEQRNFSVDPIQTVLADRGRYIADVLTIARAYLADGGKRPAGVKPFGSYPEWSRFVREPLIWLGRPDPVLSQKFTRDNDPVAAGRRAIIEAWHAAFGLEARTLAEAVRFATKPPVWEDNPEETRDETEVRLAAHRMHLEHQEQLLAALRDAFPSGRDGINTHLMGNWLRKAEGRLTAGLKFAKAEGTGHGGGILWRLTR
jgi:putative DNA primase/helicase